MNIIKFEISRRALPGVHSDLLPSNDVFCHVFLFFSNTSQRFNYLYIHTRGCNGIDFVPMFKDELVGTWTSTDIVLAVRADVVLHRTFLSSVPDLSPVNFYLAFLVDWFLSIQISLTLLPSAHKVAEDGT